MNISNPSHWPPGFAPLRLEHRYEPFMPGELAIRAADGCELALLRGLDDADGEIALGDPADVAFPLAGCWQLSVLDVDDKVIENHIFRPVANSATDCPDLSDGLSAWAAVVLSWARDPGKRRRG